MALKALVLRKRIDDKRKALAELQNNDLQKREAELVEAINEATTDEEKQAVEEAVEVFDADKKANEEAQARLSEEIAALEADLATEEAAQENGTPKQPEPEPEEKPEERGEEVKMNTSKFFGLSAEQRDAFCAREDVKNWINTYRTAITEKRAINNAGLLTPTVVLGLLRENMIEFSKLYKHVYVRQIEGEGRQVVMGAIPEAVWTDCCAQLNELSLDFNDAEFGCWKVAGYFAICNANLEDSDIDLAAELIRALGYAIGYALDKAILYGTGTRMPLGVVPRLAQTEQPAGYPTTARAWADLHTTNLVTIAAANATGVKLFQAIINAAGAAKSAYSRGVKVWAMNEATYTRLLAEAAGVDASGAIVAGVNGVMPVVGGVIEVLNFIPANTIVGGYFDLYTLAERAGARFVTSEHVRFLQDQTVFKGVARYDGQPVIAEGFVAIGIGAAPGTSVNFAAAN